MTWTAPPNCGTAEELSLAVRKLVREGVEAPPSLRFDATVQAGPNRGFYLTLNGSSERGSWSRQLVGATCEELRDAAVVLMALVIDPTPGPKDAPAPETGTRSEQRAEDTSPPPASGLPNRDSSASPGSTPPARLEAPAQGVSRPQFDQAPTVGSADARPNSKPSSDDRETLSPMRLSVTARGGFASGILPEPTLVLLLGAAPEWGRFRLSGDLGWFLPQARHVASSRERGGRFGVWLLSLQGGYAIESNRTELAMSGGLQVGYMYGRGEGVDLVTIEGAPWVAATARLAVALPLTRRWAFVAATDGWYVFGAPKFKLRASDASMLFEPSSLGAMITLGARIRLW